MIYREGKKSGRIASVKSKIWVPNEDVLWEYRKFNHKCSSLPLQDFQPLSYLLEYLL